MKLQKTGILGFGLFLCSCAAPSPPPPPSLPASETSQSVSLTMTDLTALDQMNQWSVWMGALGEMAKTHSNQSIIINYGHQISDDYQKQAASIKAVIKNNSIELTKGLSTQHQKRLSAISKLYGKAFDSALLHEIGKKEPSSLQALQKNDFQKSFSKNVIPLLKGFFDKVRHYQGQARDLMRYQ